MSLLTEEQINDILDITNVCFSSTNAKKLIEWNEKQNPQQIEIDWGTAPKCAVSAVAHVAWVTKIGNWLDGYEIAKFNRPAPIITPHPHAEIMAKYAEVAARRVDPWAEFEFRNLNSQYGWDVLSGTPSFESFYEYRHIGDSK